MINPYYDKDGITIYHGDSKEILPELEKESVDLVLTDPPYPKEFDHVWDILSLASSSMRNGSALVIFLGNYQLPRVIEALSTTLDYFWCAILPNNNQQILHGFSVKCCQKICLIFQKGKLKPNRVFFDNFMLRTITNGWKESQRLHKWGQTPSFLFEPMDAFSKPGDLILDPFVGGGTTLRVAKDMGRGAIGIDIEEECCEIAAKRCDKPSLGVMTLPKRKSLKTLGLTTTKRRKKSGNQKG